jgi:hypothetical protein
MGAHSVARQAVDPIELERWPTEPEIVDAFELDGEVHLRIAPIGDPYGVRSYVIEGLDEMCDYTFAPGPSRPCSVTGSPSRGRLAEESRAAASRHRHARLLQRWPDRIRLGHKVSPRPGFWQSYVVDADCVHPLKPQWYSGITFDAFHDEQPRLVARPAGRRSRWIFAPGAGGGGSSTRRYAESASSSPAWPFSSTTSC